MINFKEKVQEANKKLEIQNDENMSINLFFDTPNRFSNKVHMINYLNYLLRTDKEKKWNNDKTDMNLICKGGSTSTFADYDNIEDIINEFIKKYDTREIILKSMRFAAFYFDKEAEEYDAELVKFYLELYWKRYSRNRETKPMLLVVHNDQEHKLGHIIYLKNEGE